MMAKSDMCRQGALKATQALLHSTNYNPHIITISKVWVPVYVCTAALEQHKNTGKHSLESHLRKLIMYVYVMRCRVGA